uniref:Class I SAM-dependent methyltransferase n=1 Tax=Fundidesulfovibrio putealis TaxID=270496 RepID=A0A7C3W8V3_9BACT
MSDASKTWSYADYFLKKQDLIDSAMQYWKKYADNPRESDKVLLELVAAALPRDGAASLADVGCFSGNLLYLLKKRLPGLELTGYDLVERVIAANRANPELAGIDFQAADIFQLDPGKRFDVVVTNAVVGTFAELEPALRRIAAMLKPGGTYVCFDWFHPFPHELEMRETSPVFPHGVFFHFRSYAAVAALLERCGFTDVDFRPFDIPIDLPRPDPQGPDALVSYTVRGEDGRRISFKGAIHQPWCHMTAKKA